MMMHHVQQFLCAITVAVHAGLLFVFAGNALAVSPHVVEELTFKVDAPDQEKFLTEDAAIWTAALGRQPGFLSKEAWLDSGRDEIKLIIRWKTKRDWDSVPRALLQRTDALFKEAMGAIDWKMTSSRAYGVVLPGNSADYLHIDTVLSAERLRLATVVDVKNDPVYFGPKRYLAVPIKSTVVALAKQNNAREIVFECVDDYASRMPLADFLAGDPWLAFRDLDAADGESWVQKPNAPSPKKIGKAYVIWRNAEQPGDFTWPYAVERIRVATTSN